MTKHWMVAGGLNRQKLLDQYLFEMNHDTGKPYREIIESVYDSHTGLFWNGGRTPRPFDWSLEESVERITKFWNEKMGLAFYFAFNNTMLEEKHLADEDCNWMLEQCYREGNGVIIASDLLRDHVKSNYPKYRLVSSICKVKNTVEEYRDALRQYDIVVLHPDHNRDLDLVRQLEPERMEALVNEGCIRNCPNRQQHYDKLSEWILRGRPYFKERNYLACEMSVRGFPNPGDLRLFNEEVEALYDVGMRHFKLQGRNEPPNILLDRLCYYIG